MTLHPVPTPLSRRERDRRGYLDAQRAAQAMRLDAMGWRAIAAETKAVEGYGSRATEYAEGVAARYLLLAEFAEFEAGRQDEYAAAYRAHLDGTA